MGTAWGGGTAVTLYTVNYTAKLVNSCIKVIKPMSLISIYFLLHVIMYQDAVIDVTCVTGTAQLIQVELPTIPLHLSPYDKAFKNSALAIVVTNYTSLFLRIGQFEHTGLLFTK